MCTYKNKNNFHVPGKLISIIPKGVHYNYINILNKLPGNIKKLKVSKPKFKKELNKFLLRHSFFMINEFLELYIKRNDLLNKVAYANTCYLIYNI